MSGKKLLVADDSLTIQKVIRLALSNEGYEIQTVSDGNDAVQQISLFRPHVVLIDVTLPGKSAFEVKREINTHDDLAEVRFILMSSAFESFDEEQAEEVNFHGRLTKPFDPAHLRQTLTEVLSQVTAKRMEKTSLLQNPMIMKEPNLDDWKSTMDPIEPIEMDALPTVPPPPPMEPIEKLWDSNDLSLNEYVPEHKSGQNEFQQLTESTMQISGMDDFNWSISEPTLPPHPNMTQKDEPTSAGSVIPEFEMTFDEPTVPPPPQPQMPSNQMSSFSVNPVSTSELEELIRTQVQQALAQMTQKILPEIAERIIKEEIHKMLSGQ